MDEMSKKMPLCGHPNAKKEKAKSEEKGFGNENQKEFVLSKLSTFNSFIGTCFLVLVSLQ